MIRVNICIIIATYCQSKLYSYSSSEYSINETFYFACRNKGRLNDYRSSISEGSLTSSPAGSRPTTKSYSSSVNASNNGNANSGFVGGGNGGNNSSSSSGGNGSGTNPKSHFDQSRNGPSSGSTSLSSSDNHHLTSKSSVNATSSTSTASSQRVAVTPNSQDCSQQYTQSKDTALPPR